MRILATVRYDTVADSDTIVREQVGQRWATTHGPSGAQAWASFRTQTTWENIADTPEFRAWAYSLVAADVGEAVYGEAQRLAVEEPAWRERKVAATDLIGDQASAEVSSRVDRPISLWRVRLPHGGALFFSLFRAWVVADAK